MVHFYKEALSSHCVFLLPGAWVTVLQLGLKVTALCSSPALSQNPADCSPVSEQLCLDWHLVCSPLAVPQSTSKVCLLHSFFRPFDLLFKALYLLVHYSDH